MYNASSFFRIGSNHKVCEDYANYRTEYNHTNAAISDGCSSSQDTDIGARCVVHDLIRTGNYLFQRIKNNSNISPILFLREAEPLIESITRENEKSPLDCTLFGITFSESNGKSICTIGDGALVIKDSKATRIFTLEYPNNYPYYVSYWKEGYITDNKPLMKGYTFNVDGTTSYSSQEIDNVNYLSLLEDTTFAAVFSDGVFSFYKEEENGNRTHIPPVEVIKKLIDIRSYKGPFLERQINLFERFCRQNKWIHEDDISMAAIGITE